ncbi:MAG TPA: glycosyltransferase [Actinomycetota bacterium]|nr:glycosyltransferase [Actinomycetota bacterium]
MRARESPAQPAPHAPSTRPLVLLTTEEGLSGEPGCLANSLVRGLADVDFVVWSLGAVPAVLRGRNLPGNVVRTISQPSWNDLAGEPPRGNGRATRRRSRPSPREVERTFVPLLRTFLETTIDPAGPGERLAAALLDLRDAFRRWEPGATWRSPGAWDVVRDHLLVRTPDAGRPDVDPDGDRAEAWSADELPTVGEAAQALRWLGRLLAPLTVEVPWADLVHATAAGCSAIPGILAKVERGTPLILSEHGVAPRDRYLALRSMGTPFHLKRFVGDVSGALARTTYRLADRMTPASRYSMRWELAYGAARGNIEVVPPGVDDERFRPVAVPRSERPTVVQIAPVDAEHDPETLLSVAEIVRREIPDVMFVHFGEVVDQSLWERVRRLRGERGLEETVRFAGPVADVPRALALGDVALVTSRSETLPPPVLEAATCAVAVVATDTGGVREALNGGGIVAPVGNAAALADAVAATLRISPEQRDRARLGAREQAVSRFGLRRFLDDYRAQYAALGIELAPAREPAGAATDEVIRVPEAEEVIAAEPTADAPAETADEAPADAEATLETDVEVPPADSETGPEDESAAADEGVRDDVTDERAGEPSAGGGRAAAEAAMVVDRWLDVWKRVPEPSPAAEEPAGAAADQPDVPGHPVEATAAADPEAAAPEKIGARDASVPGGGDEAASERPADLRSRLADPDPLVRAEALRDLNDPSATDAAGRAMADDAPQVRLEAARALGRLNGPRAGRLLTEALSADPSREVRIEAVDALAALLARRRPDRTGGSP